MQREERDAAHVWDMLEAARAAVRFTEGLSLAGFLGGHVTQARCEAGRLERHLREQE